MALETFSTAAVNAVERGVTMTPYADATVARNGEVRIAQRESAVAAGSEGISARSIAHNR
jgi:hypothetical protein